MSTQDRHFGIDDLRESEAAVAALIDHHWGALSRNYPNLIDTFLKLPYFVEAKAANTDVEAVQFFARTHYMQAPYTFWTLYSMWRQGHYLESTILLRYLLEVVVQLRYFQRYPDQLIVHMTPKRGVRFRTMFEEFAPGFYEYYYGNLLSTFAHGKTGPLYFRIDRSQPGEDRVRMGCEYDEEAASMVMNQTLALLFSFLNLFAVYFPDNSLAQDAEVQAEVVDAIGWLENVMAANKSGFPATSDWYQHIDRLTRA